MPCTAFDLTEAETVTLHDAIRNDLSELHTEIPHPDDRKRKLYYLTEKGKDLLGLMMEIVMWGDEHMEASAPARPKVRQVQKSPARFRRKVLKDLNGWEKQFLQ